MKWKSTRFRKDREAVDDFGSRAIGSQMLNTSAFSFIYSFYFYFFLYSYCALFFKLLKVEITFKLNSKQIRCAYAVVFVRDQRAIPFTYSSVIIFVLSAVKKSHERYLYSKSTAVRLYITVERREGGWGGDGPSRGMVPAKEHHQQQQKQQQKENKCIHRIAHSMFRVNNARYKLDSMRICARLYPSIVCYCNCIYLEVRLFINASTIQRRVMVFSQVCEW